VERAMGEMLLLRYDESGRLRALPAALDADGDA
jgi:hypothetical protein